MAVVTLTMAKESYGSEYEDALFKNDGSTELKGIDFGDVETGNEYMPKYLYLRHDGLEPVYASSYYLRTLGAEWGGYVASAEDSHEPYNPNWFKHGGVKEDSGYPTNSTADYELLRNVAKNNAEMGIRIHYDRADDVTRTSGLGYDNQGLNFSGIVLQKESVDYSGTDIEEKNGYLYPEPEDDTKLGKAGDESRLGISIKLPEDIIGSGHVQFGFAIKYRYTT